MTDPSAPTRRVIVLGSTGSIGRQALEVVEHLAQSARARGEAPPIKIVALAAGAGATALFEQAQRTGVRDLALASPPPNAPTPPPGADLRTGPAAAERIVREVDADIVLAAIVGAEGLRPTLAAIDLGRDVALANKETLVAAGALVTRRAHETGARILPVDSEHSAAWQCLPSDLCPPCALGPEVSRLVLTASGGPFRTRTREQAAGATPEEALDHPTWSMGPKVTIDSATLMNKALEVIEAHWLFGLPSERIGVVIHPGSIAHALVEYADGSTIAQLGAPDMRTPIQHALTWPRRLAGLAQRADLATLGALRFEPADESRFPALRLGRRVIDTGGAAGSVVNAANEAAVQAFLERRIPFGQIVDLAEAALDELVGDTPRPALTSLDEALEADAAARGYVQSRIGSGRSASLSGRSS